ncbi:hypothetical protein MRBLMN1_001722 [Chitinophaga ginsengisegetis]|uniref:hypothetical protein n=1 Tax=Chitinophaga ginsengisegetis TaxID=393003 RepID=UPI00342B3792
MSKIHLSEEQLQRYALDGFADPAAVEHVSDCIHCQMQISAYQTLYSHIREAEASLPDFNTELLIPDLLSEVNAPDKKEAWYLYSLLSGAIGLLVAGLIVYWNTISWIFSGIGTIGLVLSLVLLSGILAMQLIELYGTYRKKMKALNPE